VTFDSEVILGDAADVRRSPPYWYNPNKYAEREAYALERCEDEIWGRIDHLGKPNYMSDVIDYFPDSSELDSWDDWRLEFMDED
jgi:hypothetical protein